MKEVKVIPTNQQQPKALCFSCDIFINYIVRVPFNNFWKWTYYPKKKSQQEKKHCYNWNPKFKVIYCTKLIFQLQDKTKRGRSALAFIEKSLLVTFRRWLLQKVLVYFCFFFISMGRNIFDRAFAVVVYALTGDVCIYVCAR